MVVIGQNSELNGLKFDLGAALFCEQSVKPI